MDEGAAAAAAAGGACRAESLVRVLCRWKEPDLREVVGVMGEPESLVGDVGESRSREPDESLVRFFLRKPRVGIGGRRAGEGAGIKGRDQRNAAERALSYAANVRCSVVQQHHGMRKPKAQLSRS